MERKIALVTGAGSGIGRGVALALGAAGYDVALGYATSEVGARGAAEEIERGGGRACAIQADISTLSGVDALFAGVREAFGRLDLVVANAGVTIKEPFLEISEAGFDKIVNLDFKGTLFTVQRAARLMVETGTQGSAVVIASNHFTAQFAECAVYGSVKTALVKLVKHAGVELAKYGIRVNAIAPGWTDTGAARLDAKESTYYKIPLKRWTTPEEIGSAVLYLASEGARSVTGACLTIDGGASLQCDKPDKYGL